MKFSFPLPTCMEGLNQPPGFGSAEDLVKIAETAEALGFYAVWANDHVAPWPRLREAAKQPLNWYDSLISTSYCARATSTIKLGLGVVVVPFRDPVILAKQVATLDQFSGGRVVMGVGVGTPRDEFATLRPRDVRSNRGEMVDELLEAIDLLWNRPAAAFNGKYYQFEELEAYPKPVQSPLPIYVSGGAPATLKRVARYGSGLLMSSGPIDSMRSRVDDLERELAQAGRDISEVDVAVSFAVSLASTSEKAQERFFDSHVGHRFMSWATDEETVEGMIGRNLVGTPEEAAEHIRQRAEAGMTHCAPQHIAAESVDEMMEQMHIYAEQVVPLCAGL